MSGQPVSGEIGLAAVSPPRIHRETFRAILTDHQSPAAPIAGALYDIFVAEGVDPAVGLAFFWKESSLGNAGLTPTYNLKNWGNVRSPEDPRLGTIVSIPGRGPFARYPSWENGVRDFCKRIKGPKYAGAGLHTVEAILPKYAPSSDGNRPAAYAAKVVELVRRWSGEGESPGPETYRIRVTATDGLNFRQGAHTRYPVAGTLPFGAVVEADGTKDEGQGDWHHLADHRGFVSGAYVERL